MEKRRQDYYKGRWKRYVVATLYALLLLAEAGEFFVANETHYPQNQHTEAVHTMDIPDHLPEGNEKKELKAVKVCTINRAYRVHSVSANKSCCMETIFTDTELSANTLAENIA
ncbi:MAG: hypothetical protein WD187_01685 [Candidatus Woykebacteria bacterium]